jgi:hypothetical protein
MVAAAPAKRILERTSAVVDYHRDVEHAGRPLGVLLGGASLALVSAALCARLAYQVWYAHALDSDQGIFGVSFLFVFFVLGCYLFSYGFELYDQRKALRLTLVFAVCGVIALAVMIAVLVALAYLQVGAGIALSERQQNTAMSAAMSFAGGSVGPDPDGGKHAEPVPGLPMLSCESCGRDFIAVPPDAVCPWCDTPYLVGSVAKTA